MNKETFTTQLSSAVSQCLTWRNTLLKASNDELYEIFAQCRTLHCSVLENKDLLSALMEYMSEKEINCKANSPLEVKIVNVVFESSSKSCKSTYSKVLKAAKQQEIEPSDIPSWIVEKGGIQEIKLSQAKSGETSEDKRQKGISTFNDAKPLYKIPPIVDTPKEGTVVLIIGRVNEQKETEVVEFLDNESLLKDAFIKYYAQHKHLLDKGTLEAREKIDAINKLKAERNNASISEQQKEGVQGD